MATPVACGWVGALIEKDNSCSELKKLIYAEKVTSDAGSQYFADRWTGSYNPNPYPPPPHAHSHTQKIITVAS